MNTFEDYKEAILANPSPYAREALRAEAAACGLDRKSTRLNSSH